MGIKETHWWWTREYWLFLYYSPSDQSVVSYDSCSLLHIIKTCCVQTNQQHNTGGNLNARRREKRRLLTAKTEFHEIRTKSIVGLCKRLPVWRRNPATSCVVVQMESILGTFVKSGGERCQVRHSAPWFMCVQDYSKTSLLRKSSWYMFRQPL